MMKNYYDRNEDAESYEGRITKIKVKEKEDDESLVEGLILLAP